MSPSRIRAIRVHEYGGPENLLLEEIDCPQPAGNKVLVRMKSAGVNPVDWKHRSGMIRQFMPLTFPWTPGIDGAGIVEAIGPEVKGVRPGDAVFGVFQGSYAEMALAADGDLQPKPANLTFDEAAAVPVGALTAWKAVIEDGAVQRGQSILVLGAAGGVGLFAVQFARWKGARVTGTASAANVPFVRALGADVVVDYTAGPFEKGMSGLDVVFDTVGGETLERSLAVLKKGGIVMSVAGPVPEEAVRAREVRAVRTGRASSDRLRQVAELLQAGTVRAFVGEVFSLADAARAHRFSETRHGRGRVILHIAD